MIMGVASSSTPASSGSCARKSSWAGKVAGTAKPRWRKGGWVSVRPGGVRCTKPAWAPRIILSYAARVAPVHAIEAGRINVEPLQRSVRGQGVNARQAVDCGEVADTAQQADRDARGAPRPLRDLCGAVGA